MLNTEQNLIECPFYSKIGACRHENECLRIHNKPSESQTVLLKHMYQNSPSELALAQGQTISEEDAKEDLNVFEEFYQDVYLELSQYGEIKEFIVCDNTVSHLKGNVYVQYIRENDALKCVMALKNRYYGGFQLMPELSPVIDFSNAKCKDYLNGKCNRNGLCNFLHPKKISEEILDTMRITINQRMPTASRL